MGVNFTTYGVIVGILSLFFGIVLMFLKKLDTVLADKNSTEKEIRTKRLIISIVAITAGLMSLSAVLLGWPPVRGYLIPPSATKSTTSGTTSPESSESTYTEELVEIRKHQLQEADWKILIEKGLQDPINDLVQDLMKHNELIPCEGTVGGTPGFNDPDRIAVLSRDRVIADYDDGHVEGTVELAYTVFDGAISWTVVNAECGD